MSDLLLTLGHNASAIAISVGDDGVARVENAYELERLSGVKSDSRFPIDAMVALKERGVASFDRVYVTHWSPSGRVDELKAKYWDRSVFPNNIPVYAQETFGLSHHDCHAYAALAFAGDDFPKKDSGLLVVDGFGSMGEHLSYYRLDEKSGRPMLIKRIHGYYTSLGLMYQYATAFLGMKMHEDEYKLLGYAAQVVNVDIPLRQLEEMAMDRTQKLLKAMRHMHPAKMSVDLAMLPAVQEQWANTFRGVLDELGMVGCASDSHEARCIIGFVVQAILELTIKNLFFHELPKPKNLIMTGGVAFNVELNRMLLGFVPGKLCVMPLAGDQGNSLGLWSFHNRRAELDFGDLCWGKRSFTTDVAPEHLPEGLMLFDGDSVIVASEIESALETVGFVNVVRGNMEFGPRALCNTTTLAKANDPAIVEEINRINGRNTVMPFAPVVWHEFIRDVFPDIPRLHKSENFMIAALRYAPNIGEDFAGAALKTARGFLTGRPQRYAPKYDGDSVAAIVQKYGILINTSFNVHGVPICLDLKDVIHSHQFQRERNPNVRTIVIRN